MAKIEERGQSNFRDILPMLVEYSNFPNYLDAFLLQNNFMEQYKIIRVLKDKTFD